MSLKKFAVGLCCLAVLSVGAAEAARKVVIKGLPVNTFEGVDDVGQLDGNDVNFGIIKATINLSNGLATVSGKANVPNLSFRKAVFLDYDPTFLGATLITSKYTVTARGKATFNGKYADAI